MVHQQDSAGQIVAGFGCLQTAVCAEGLKRADRDYCPHFVPDINLLSSTVFDIFMQCTQCVQGPNALRRGLEHSGFAKKKWRTRQESNL
jgi:hypothetical protein